MVPKPDGTFRMCVDYRALNDCTADVSRPIPNMLRRIGSQKPKIFGIMDLTQGYHQAPLPSQQENTLHSLPFLGYISSHDCPLDQNELHLIFKKS